MSFTIAEVHKFVNAGEYLSAVSDTELMGAIANVQGIVMMNRSIHRTSYRNRL